MGGILGDNLGEGNCESKIASRQWGDNFCRETSICLAGPSGSGTEPEPGNRNRRNRFSRNRKRNRNRRNRFPGTEAGTVLFCYTVLKHRKPLFTEEPRNRRNRKPEPLEPFNPQTATEPNRTGVSLKFALSKFYCRGVSHEKQRFRDDFPLCPQLRPPPSKSENFILIVVSPSLTLSRAFLFIKFRRVTIQGAQQPSARLRGKFAPQKVLRGFCRGLLEGSAGGLRGPLRGSAGFSQGSDSILVTLEIGERLMKGGEKTHTQVVGQTLDPPPIAL